MHTLMPLALALIVGQAEPAGGAEAAEGTPAPAAPAAPAPQPAAQPPAAQPPTPTPAAQPTSPAAGAGGAAAAEERAPQAARPAAGAADGRAAARPAEPERAQVARAALAFLDALVAGDAAGLAAASAERFSFDGDVRSGKEEIRRTWRALLAGRDPAPRPALLDLELLPAAEAAARLGNPPPRIAALASAKGGWIGIANVSRRPVVLILAREGARWAVVGME